MRKVLLFLGVATLSFNANAQVTPAKSAGCKLTQTVGLTDITVEYSRPDVDGRTIFGELVKYDEMWRTGANKATMINFADDVTINNENVPAGSYSLFTIPGKKEWTIIINKNTELWGIGGYKQEEDQLRFKVNSQTLGNKYETFTIDFSDLEDESGKLNLTWENTRVSFGIKVKSEEQAWASIEESIKEQEGSWRVYVRAAQYAVSKGKKLDEAVEWTNKALAMEESWWAYMVQGEVYAAKGDYKNAIKSAKKSLKLGESVDKWPYKERVEGQLKDYESKK